MAMLVCNHWARHLGIEEIGFRAVPGGVGKAGEEATQSGKGPLNDLA